MVLCFALEFSQDALIAREGSGSGQGFARDEAREGVLYDAQTLTPSFRAGTASSEVIHFELIARISKRITVLCEQNAAEHSRSPGLCLPILIFRGHGLVKSAADILPQLHPYRIASGCTAVQVPTPRLPVAFQGRAAHWWISRENWPFAPWGDFRRPFRAEFLPVHCEIRVMDELRSRTQLLDQSLVEFIPCMQELILRGSWITWRCRK